MKRTKRKPLPKSERVDADDIFGVSRADFPGRVHFDGGAGAGQLVKSDHASLEAKSIHEARERAGRAFDWTG